MFTMLYPRRVLSGPGCLSALGQELQNRFAGVLIVAGSGSLRRSGVLERIEADLREAGLRIRVFEGVEPEPSVDTATMCTGALSEFRDSLRAPVAVLGIGGGSVLDVAKAAAGLVNEPSTVAEIFRGKSILTKGVPFAAVPTTAGSGAEATTNAVLTDTETGTKASIRSDSLLAELVILDPALTCSAPPAVTAASGMDALVQAIEGYTSIHANEFTRPLSREAVQLIGHNLVRVYSDGDDLAAREAMLKASFLGAVAFANCRLGAVHGIAHPVGVRYRTPHGVVCAILLPYVMRFNMQDCVEDYARLARDMGIAKKRTSARVMAASLIGMIEELNRKLGIPSKLKEIGLRRDDISAIAEESLPSGSLRANRRKMTREDIEVLLEANL
jgi:alcohol dehydrogenase class IV